MDDEMLLQATGRGNRIAFRELFRRYVPPLTRFVRRLAGRPIEHEEVLQDIMLRIWTRAPLFDPARGKARPWIYRLAGRVTINFFASRAGQTPRREIPTDEFVNPPQAREPGPEETALRLDDSRRVQECLTRLDDEFRQPLVLRHLEGMGIEEIAGILEIPEGTVKSRIFYGLKRLRELLGKEPPHVVAQRVS